MDCVDDIYRATLTSFCRPLIEDLDRMSYIPFLWNAIPLSWFTSTHNSIPELILRRDPRLASLLTKFESKEAGDSTFLEKIHELIRTYKNQTLSNHHHAMHIHKLWWILANMIATDLILHDLTFSVRSPNSNLIFKFNFNKPENILDKYKQNFASSTFNNYPPSQISSVFP